MVMLSEAQSSVELTSAVDHDECLLCVNEAEFLALLNNLVQQLRAAADC